MKILKFVIGSRITEETNPEIKSGKDRRLLAVFKDSLLKIMMIMVELVMRPVKMIGELMQENTILSQSDNMIIV